MSTDSIHHLFLTQADDQDQARHKVLHFLDNTELIRYDATTIRNEGIINATSASFWPSLNEAMASNRQFAEELIRELEETGVSRLQDLRDLPQGYPSKTLHTLTHILDGFIGVDSAFYNLLEDSHWISDRLQEDVRKKSGQYWLVPVVPGKLQFAVFHGGGR